MRCRGRRGWRIEVFLPEKQNARLDELCSFPQLSSSWQLAPLVDRSPQTLLLPRQPTPGELISTPGTLSSLQLLNRFALRHHIRSLSVLSKSSEELLGELKLRPAQIIVNEEIKKIWWKKLKLHRL